MVAVRKPNDLSTDPAINISSAEFYCWESAQLFSLVAAETKQQSSFISLQIHQQMSGCIFDLISQGGNNPFPLESELLFDL